jgi:hypothetical protein
MLLSEFIDRTGYQPSADEYREIEKAYYVFKGDKDAFCRAWCKSNPHKKGQLWAAIKENERQARVFDNVCRFVTRCKVRREQLYTMTTPELCEFLEGMREKCKCKDKGELRSMVYKLAKSSAVMHGWKWHAVDLVYGLEMFV